MATTGRNYRKKFRAQFLRTEPVYSCKRSASNSKLTAHEAKEVG